MSTNVEKPKKSLFTGKKETTSEKKPKPEKAVKGKKASAEKKQKAPKQKKSGKSSKLLSIRNTSGQHAGKKAVSDGKAGFGAEILPQLGSFR